jgi:hypothetical protein
MNAYFSEHAFKPTTTEQCLAFMDRNLFNGDSNRRNALKVRQWIYETGLPDNCPKINPERFVLVDQQRALLESGAPVSALNTLGWTTHEWLQFLRKMPRPTKIEWMTDLDQRFQLTKSTNSEIADEWFKLSIASNYQEAFDEMEIFLSQVGRKKFLEPLYLEMKKTPENLKMAQRIFAKYRNNYHPQTASKIEKILNAK